MESVIVWNHHVNIIKVYFIILKLRKLDLKLKTTSIFLPMHTAQENQTVLIGSILDDNWHKVPNET